VCSAADEFCERQKRLGGELDGGHAQYCKVPAANLQRIPDHMGFEGSVDVPAGRPHRLALSVRARRLQQGEDILIQAAGSGVGASAS
jgi:NADPH:quinone reductase-like Zn-dependent oxidoreductase